MINLPVSTYVPPWLVCLLQAAQSAATASQSGVIPTTSGGAIDYSKDFFGERAYLAVSGQLNGKQRGADGEPGLA